MISGAKLGNKTLITKLKPPYFTPPLKKFAKGVKIKQITNNFPSKKINISFEEIVKN